MHVLQAIYPTFIIVLVAMKRSPIDRGVSQVNGAHEEHRPGVVQSTLVFRHTVGGTSGTTQHTIDSSVHSLACQDDSDDVAFSGLDSPDTEKRDHGNEV